MIGIVVMIELHPAVYSYSSIPMFQMVLLQT